jgi:hypothetical protein
MTRMAIRHENALQKAIMILDARMNYPRITRISRMKTRQDGTLAARVPPSTGPA